MNKGAESITKRFLNALLITVFVLQSVAVQPALFAEEEEESIKPHGYTINFNNVSVIEYLRFVSKIAGVNFIFEDKDLQFNVSVVSEDPINPENVVSTLIQVLRIHNLKLLEQEGNLVIIPNEEVNQLSQVISKELDNIDMEKSPLITRVFPIKNNNPNAIAEIIRPMTSATAIIEVMQETRQLIVSDITTNISKIAELLESLDAPHTPLEIETYTSKFLTPEELIELVNQILRPFSESNPLILVSQPQTNTIFIVSTPSLIDRALTVMEDLDLPPQQRVGQALSLRNELFFYKIQNPSPEFVISALNKTIDELKKLDPEPKKLIDTLEHATYIPESCSLMFTGDSAIEGRVRHLLEELDTLCYPEKGKPTFYVYQLKYATPEYIKDALEKMLNSFKQSGMPDDDLISAIHSMYYIPESNTIIFTGYTGALDRLASIIPTLDAKAPDGFGEQYFVYHPKNRHGEELLASLKNLANNFEASGLRDPALINAIESARFLSESNSIIFTGSQQTIDRIKGLLIDLDTPTEEMHRFGRDSGAYTFFIYELKYANGELVLKELNRVINRLDMDVVPNRQLMEVVKDMQYIPQHNSIVITGPQKTVDIAKRLIDQYDVPDGNLIDENQLQGILEGAPTRRYDIQTIGDVSFLVYKPQFISPTQLMTQLRAVGKDLKKSKIKDKSIVETIDSMRMVQETGSVLFTGPESALMELTNLIEKFDTPSGITPSAATARRVPSLLSAPTTFSLYNPHYRGGEELIHTTQDFQQQLIDSGVQEPDLYDTIENLRWMPMTNSIIVSGSQASIDRTKDLLSKFDTPAEQPDGIDNTSFFVYKLQYHQGNEIQQALSLIGESLLGVVITEGEKIQNEDLINAINALQWIQVTNSLVSTGHPEALRKLRTLIDNLDIPLRQVFIEVLAIETTINNAQNFGLQWAGRAKFRNKFATSVGNTQPIAPNAFVNEVNRVNATNFPDPSLIPTSGGLDLGVIGDLILHKGKSFISLGSLVDALQTDGDSSIILNPKIITQDNKNSTIFVGSNIPFVGSVVTNSAANVQTSTSIEYRNVGVNLSITPILGDENIVTLEITTEISSLPLGLPQVATDQVSGLVTDQTTMNTRVHVPDQHFLVLSGIIQDNKERGNTGIPCLGGLPVVGAAFNSMNRSVNVRNVLLFIRPHIINSWADYVQVTENTEELHKEVADLPILREEFDEATNYFKSLTDLVK